jgi:haloalkane dehalogenase
MVVLVLKGLAALFCLPLFVLGIKSIFKPTSMLEDIALEPQGIAGLSSIRGVFGGMFLSSVVLIVIGLATGNTSWFLPVAVLMGIAGFGRVVGILKDGRDQSVIKPTVVEFVIAGVLVAAHIANTDWMNLLPTKIPTVAAEANISGAFPYESHGVDVLDSKMHYVEQGEGPPMLLLHGNPTSSYLWRNVIPHLSKDHRVIAVDLIGMGASGKPDIDYRFADHVRYIDAFIEAMALKDVVLVLHDWGGGVGFDHAMRHQDNIRGIAFFEAVVVTTKWSDLTPPERYLFKTMRSDAGDALLINENYFVEKLVPAFSGRALTDREMAAYRAPFLDPSSRKPARVWPQEVVFDGEPADNAARITATYEKLKASKVPLLLLTADPGAIMKPALVARLQADLPRMQTEKVGPGLHYVQESQPTNIGRAVHEWASQLPDVGLTP